MGVAGAWEYQTILEDHERSLCVTRPKTYLLWFWLPPSFPIRSIHSHCVPTGDFTVAFGHGHPLVLIVGGQVHDFFPLLLLSHLADSFCFAGVDVGPFLLFLVIPPQLGVLSE